MEIGVGCLVCNLPAIVGLLRGRAKNPLSSFLAQISLNSLRSNRSNNNNKAAGARPGGGSTGGTGGGSGNGSDGSHNGPTTTATRYGSAPGFDEESQAIKGEFGLHLQPLPSGGNYGHGGPGTREWYDDVPLQGRVSTTTAGTGGSHEGRYYTGSAGTTEEAKRGVSVDS